MAQPNINIELKRKKKKIPDGINMQDFSFSCWSLDRMDGWIFHWWGPQHCEGCINCMYNSDGQYAKSVIRDSINCIQEKWGDMRDGGGRYIL